MSDLISRQTAIDAINTALFPKINTAKDAEKALRNLPSAQPEQQWIPCSERLPDEYGEYLVTKHTFGWNSEEYVSNDIAYFDNDGFHKADMVIAWMPLPEPYADG